MKLHEHILPSDMVEASQEKHCSQDLLQLIAERLELGDIESAKHHSIDLTKSLHELSKLTDKKRKAVQFDQLIDQMNTAGIHIELVRRKLLEK